MRHYTRILLRLWKFLEDFQNELYIQILISASIQLGKVATTFLIAEIIDLLINKNVNSIVIMLLIYPLISLTIDRINLMRERHKLKYLDQKINTFLTDIPHSKDKQLHADGVVAIDHIVSIFVNKFIPIAAYLIFAIIAIAYYSPLIAAWCIAKIIVLIIWLEKYAAKRHAKSLTAKLSYNITHGHRRELFSIFGKYIALIFAVSLYLHGRVSVGGVYAVFYWTSDVFGNLQTVVNSIKNNENKFTDLENYLDEMETKSA